MPAAAIAALFFAIAAWPVTAREWWRPWPVTAREWWEAETDHFVIRAQDDEAEIRRFATELERFDMALRSLQGLPRDEEPPSRATKLTVYRFGDSRDNGRLWGTASVAGFFIPRASDSVGYAPARQERPRSLSVTDFSRNQERRSRGSTRPACCSTNMSTIS